jgi:hydrogenase maturation protein HypF
VQGVGFRPFVYRLATEMGLPGWVNNSAQGVFIEVEGERERLEAFLLRLEPEKPPRAFIQSLESSFLDPVGYTTFEIRHSEEAGAKTAFVLPDLAVCPDCLREIFDPSDRRYRYPFTNCTNCGPRFSILLALLYDRPNTTMRVFPMCEACRAEYENPSDRRFHAQPNACPACGPHVELWDGAGATLATHYDALLAAAGAIRHGRIVAVKGLGGFHLMCDARSEEAVRLLRQRKRREEKPFALMFPSLESVTAMCEVSDMEARLLRSPESPIVLLRRKQVVGSLGRWVIGKPDHPTTQSPNDPITPSVAPGNPTLGVMLPYTPLHHLLMAELGFPVVATSGNLSDEPICTDEREALERLGGIADLFLVHNRPIARHVDDSVARVMLGREMVLRRARGYAPLPVTLREPLPTLLAVGAHLKNTVAVSVGRQVFGSQHIGDLETAQAFDAFRRVIADFENLYELKPGAVACDLHPDYLSTHYAERSGLPVVRVQHHYAHVLACMAENEMDAPVLGVSWDGTGYGTDGTVWGGEFLRVTADGFERAARLRTFRLPGGERAVKEPRRAAMGLLYELFGDRLFTSPLPLTPSREGRGNTMALPPGGGGLGGGETLRAFSPAELVVLRRMLAQGVNAPVTSSMGRLFDAVASIVGLRQTVRFEGQAAMELEFALHGVETEEAYPFEVAERNGQPAVVDWGPMICAILVDGECGLPAGMISAKFHNALAEMIVTVAGRVEEERVVLSGGCFQNRYLTERAVRRLRAEGFRPYWHQRVPPNDGGIALGQVMAAGRERPGGVTG